MRYYSASDMVKIGCDDCKGCHDCCQGMGDTVLVNPYDAYMLIKNLGKSFDKLLEKEIALHVENGMILPHLQMSGEEESCVFLNEQGRCSIHPFRPGLCRLFPMGRKYKEKGFDYFLLEGACPKENKTKVKIDKWLGVKQLSKQEAFLDNWHRFCVAFQEKIEPMLQEDEQEAYLKQLNMFILHTMFIEPYKIEDDFYLQYEERIDKVRAICQI